jgi:hypothetical protein
MRSLTPSNSSTPLSTRRIRTTGTPFSSATWYRARWHCAAAIAKQPDPGCGRQATRRGRHSSIPSAPTCRSPGTCSLAWRRFPARVWPLAQDASRGGTRPPPTRGRQYWSSSISAGSFGQWAVTGSSSGRSRCGTASSRISAPIFITEFRRGRRPVDGPRCRLGARCEGCHGRWPTRICLEISSSISGKRRALLFRDRF